MKFTAIKTVEAEFTIQDIATAFANERSDVQAEFINLIGEAFLKESWAEKQLCAISDDISKDGKFFLFALSNYVKVQGLSMTSKHVDTLINSYQTE